ncbi:hypothetical protein EDI_271650 [Entamoeba dispar SAW760]|uniref:UEV domain-containing protein n=1 Tax=Entamoeba dispar (strain ATCC PRA-260 / SAW760) TaxID=370354 RepID=B0EFM8_ENTDS|nr:uncharacterized protein EDI_271650 [Entamoeba dispar SAW760]EDR26659.1 hypothetical protein EDI_271650 [Entamoeba dispar SAW760]|eukprot:EDR26659.1 hypothetical protein EDI_271650 [Entamoeba dispar SAW760]
MQSINDIKNIIGPIKKYYEDFDSIEQDIRSILSKYPKFRFGTLTSRISGNQLLVLTGFLPILFNGKKFGIPLLIGFTYEYPISAPEMICNISEGMEIVKNHPEVDENGIIRKVSNEWNPSSDLLMVLDSLAKSFGTIPPVRQTQNNLVTNTQRYPITTSTNSIQPNLYNNFIKPCSLTPSQIFNSSYSNSPYCQPRNIPLQPQHQYQSNSSYQQPVTNKLPYSQEMHSFNPSLQSSSSYDYQNHLTLINPSVQPQCQSFNTTPIKSSVPAEVVQSTSFSSINPPFSPSFSDSQQPIYYSSFSTTSPTNPITAYPLQSQEQRVQVNGYIKKTGDDPYLVDYNSISKPTPSQFVSMPSHSMTQLEADNKLNPSHLKSEEETNRLMKYKDDKKKEEDNKIFPNEEKERRKKENEIIQKEKLQNKINKTKKAINEISCWIEKNSCENFELQQMLLQKITDDEQNRMKSVSQCIAIDDCIEILSDATKNKVISIEDALEQLKKITSIQFHAKYYVAK